MGMFDGYSIYISIALVVVWLLDLAVHVSLRAVDDWREHWFGQPGSVDTDAKEVCRVGSVAETTDQQTALCDGRGERAAVQLYVPIRSGAAGSGCDRSSCSRPENAIVLGRNADPATVGDGDRESRIGSGGSVEWR